MSRWKITLYRDHFIVDAENEREARLEALQALAESLDLFVVEDAGSPNEDTE
jgi:hypothetical protein